VAGNLKAWPSALKNDKRWKSFSPRAFTPRETYRSLPRLPEPPFRRAAPTTPGLRATFETLPDGYYLMVGKDISELNEFARKISTAFGLVIALIVLLAGAASVSVTRRTVVRIEGINATSRAMMQSRLGKRIPLHGTLDEWDQLAENLNSMLDRIETLMAEVRHVSDNVAHDLRTCAAHILLREPRK